MSNQDKDFCAIVFIGGGSSWAWAPSKEEAATKAAKQCKRDWKTLYQFKRKHEFKVCVYDMKDHDGWYADYRGVFDSKTKQEIPLLEVVEVTA